MLQGISRSKVKLTIGDKSITIVGEWFLPDGERPIFSASPDDIREWDSPHNDEPISESDRKMIFDIFVEEMDNKWNAIVDMS